MPLNKETETETEPNQNLSVLWIKLPWPEYPSDTYT